MLSALWANDSENFKQPGWTEKWKKNIKKSYRLNFKKHCLNDYLKISVICKIFECSEPTENNQNRNIGAYCGAFRKRGIEGDNRINVPNNFLRIKMQQKLSGPPAHNFTLSPYLGFTYSEQKREIVKSQPFAGQSLHLSRASNALFGNFGVPSLQWRQTSEGTTNDESLLSHPWDLFWNKYLLKSFLSFEIEVLSQHVEENETEDLGSLLGFKLKLCILDYHFVDLNEFYFLNYVFLPIGGGFCVWVWRRRKRRRRFSTTKWRVMIGRIKDFPRFLKTKQNSLI